MRSVIYALDRLLRRLSGMFEFCDDPDCVFRVSVDVAAYPLRVPSGEIPAGAKVVQLHFWNEHMPAMPLDGSVIGPAVKLRRMVASSARLLARQIREDPRLDGVRAVGGVTPLFIAGQGSPAERIFLRLGFAVMPHRNPSGRFMEFWEEVYAWMLMWAFTPGNRNHRSLRGIRRSDFWISAEDFLNLYGGPSSQT
jgi:YkoP domain